MTKYYLFGIQMDGLCIITIIWNNLGTFGMIKCSIIPRQAAKIRFLCGKSPFNI